MSNIPRLRTRSFSLHVILLADEVTAGVSRHENHQSLKIELHSGTGAGTTGLVYDHFLHDSWDGALQLYTTKPAWGKCITIHLLH